MAFFEPLSNIAPFTYRDGETYLQRLRRLQEWCINTGITTTQQINSVIEQFDKGMEDTREDAESARDSADAASLAASDARALAETMQILQADGLAALLLDEDGVGRDAALDLFNHITVNPQGGDDTAGVQTFLDEVRTGKRVGYLRDNTYRVTNLSIDFTADTAIALGHRAPRISGGSKRNTIIQQIPGTEGDVLTVTGVGNTTSHAGKVTGFALENLSIQGNENGGSGIKLRSFTDVKLEDLWISHCGEHGIALDRQTFNGGVEEDYAYGLQIRDSKILLNGGRGIACVGRYPIGPALLEGLEIESNALGGIYVNPSSFTLVECYIGGNGGPGIEAEYATHSLNSWGLRMFGGRLEGNTGYEAYIKSGLGATFNNVVVLATNGAHAYRIGDNSSKSASGAQIIGGFIAGNKTAGQKLAIIGSNARGVKIENPEFDAVQFTGDYVSSIMDLITDNGTQTTEVRHRGYSRMPTRAMSTSFTDRTYESWVVGELIRRFGIRGDGLLSWGDGVNNADVQLQRLTADRLNMGPGDSFMVDGVWDGGKLMSGPWRTWFDSNERMRIKVSEPANEFDGKVIAGFGALWDEPKLTIGPWRFWVDSTDKLRMKSSEPTSETDGIVVGSQGA